MKKALFLIFAFMILSSHDMFLKLDGYFLSPNAPASIKLFNGTFEKSENVITRDRMIDVSLVSNGQRTRLDTSYWIEKDSTTILNFETGAEGTYVVGVSTKARNIEMKSADFNSYLEHDGILDMIAWRKTNNAMDQDAVEKYSKHVKTIFQVGNKRSEDWAIVLGYPIEFVPKTNPYELFTGDKIEVQLLASGKALANQLVYVGTQAPINGHSHDQAEASHSHGDGEVHSHEGEVHEHSHGQGEVHSHEGEDHEHSHGEGEVHSHEGEGHEHSHDGNIEEDNHSHDNGIQLRTDSEGMLTVNLSSDGIWHLRTINLEISEEEGLTHESNWATLTFEVGHSHENLDEHHAHEDETPFGIPSYAYWLGSLALIGILFFVFYRKG